MTDRAMPVLPDPDDLLKLPDGDHYELVDGVAVEKMPGAEAAQVGLLVAAQL